MIPHLIKLGTSPAVASLVYVINPLVGFFVQPLIGDASDNCSSRYGKRSPFIVVLAFTGVYGFGTLVLSHFIAEAITATNKELDLAVAETVLCMLAFGLADISHDLLLVPGRALVLDLAAAKNVVAANGGASSSAEAKASDEADALYTLYQLGGRLAALVLGTLPLEHVFDTLLGAVKISSGHVTHFQALLSSSCLLLFCCACLAVGAAKEWELVQQQRQQRQCVPDSGSNGYQQVSVEDNQENGVEQSLSDSNNNSGDGGTKSNSSSRHHLGGRKTMQLRILLAIQFLGKCQNQSGSHSPTVRSRAQEIIRRQLHFSSQSHSFINHFVLALLSFFPQRLGAAA
jgi:hypothetical protein